MDSAPPWQAGSSHGLDFTSIDVAETGSLALTLNRLGALVGIYWLMFDDGSEYVGKSINTVRRLATHRRHQPGALMTVAFAPVDEDHLDDAERWFIGQRDAAGASLRNKLITLKPGGHGPGSYAVRTGEAVPLPWDRNQRGRVPEDFVSESVEVSDLKRRQWDTLRAHEDWPTIRRFLRTFVRETLSAPHLTAGDLWTVSAMPGTVRFAGWHRLCTLNVGRIEALFIGAADESGAVLVWNVTSHTPEFTDRLKAATRPLLATGDAELRLHDYSEETIAVVVEGIDRAFAFAEVPEVLDLAYGFNTMHQRRGVTMQRRAHNPLFAADLLGPT